jgi:DNA uptake protein ComE-like DNA-binding protein
MKLSPGKKNRGIAVLVALVAVTVLTILAGIFAYSMKVETHLAANANHDQQFYWIGVAGAQYACYVLDQDKGSSHSDKMQYWAGGPGEGPQTNGPGLLYPISHVDVSDAGWCELEMIDGERKVNINSAPAPLLQQVFNNMQMDPGDAATISDSILDWIDPDDATRAAGAESDYYQGQNPPYYAKNAPMDDITELWSVKGVKELIERGQENAATAAGTLPRHNLGLGHALAGADNQVITFDDFTKYFTTLSSGKIDINTADADSLMLIPGMDQQSAESIIKFRSGVSGQDGETPIQNPGQLAAAGVDPRVAGQIGQFTTVKSSVWEVHITAHIGEFAREFVAVVAVTGSHASIVEFYGK